MPTLNIIAGCNGAGKSTFASTFLPEGMISFDYDRVYLEIYNSLSDSELREQLAKNKASEMFENHILKNLDNNTDFCYETNLDEHPIHWAKKFKAKNYTVNLIFFCLESIEIANKRVEVRNEFKGHFIDDATVRKKWKDGYKNLNKHWSFFDNVLLVDNSTQDRVYQPILQIEDGKFEIMNEPIPDYFPRRVPEIYKHIEDSKKHTGLHK